MKPHIHRESMKSIVIKVGQSVEFDVLVSGEPPPEKVWIFNDKPIEGDKHVKVSLNSVELNEEPKKMQKLR